MKMISLRLIVFAVWFFVSIPAFGKNYLVLSAFDYETTLNREVVSGIGKPIGVASFNGVRVEGYRVGSMSAYLAETGVSMVNAAMTVQLLLDKLPVDGVIFAGIAGGVNPKFGPGDVVVPERWYHHSEASYLNPDPKRPGKFIIPHPEDFVPRYPNFGMIFPNNVSVVRAGEKRREIPFFSVSPRLLNEVRAALRRTTFEEVLGREPLVKIGGRGVAGPVFLDNRDYRAFVFKTWRADIVDMESTAIGQVCYANQKPFVIIRGISDLAGGQKGQNEEFLFGRAAARHAAQLMGNVLKGLGGEQ